MPNAGGAAFWTLADDVREKMDAGLSQQKSAAGKRSRSDAMDESDGYVSPRLLTKGEILGILEQITAR